MFVEWRRRHPVVTLLLPRQTEAVPVVDRPWLPSARQRPPGCGDAAAAFLQHDLLPSFGAVAVSVPVEVVGHVPAASVSDTVTSLAQPIMNRRQPSDVCRKGYSDEQLKNFISVVRFGRRLGMYLLLSIWSLLYFH